MVRPDEGDDMEDRMIRQEEKIAHLENTVETLDGVVRSLNDQVAQLRREMDDVRGKLLPSPEERNAEEDIPPHYGR